jgi:3-hydroxyacyl-CoA dehydrogenase
MFRADEQGLANVLADIRKFHAEHGAAWEPAPLIERLVKDGKSFRDMPSPG